jgi:hypothetical protein
MGSKGIEAGVFQWRYLQPYIADRSSDSEIFAAITGKSLISA